jgi:glycosyltransferase involved in cell wall biosynthesis
MRVLLCISSMHGGGAERQVAYLAEGLVQRGLEVHVAITAGGPNLARLEGVGAVVHFLKARSTRDPLLVQQLARTIRAIRPDVVQPWLLQMEVLTGLATRVSRVPWILTERSSQLAYPPTIRNALRGALARTASAIVSNSRGGDEYWRGRAGRHLPRFVIPNAVPIDEIALAGPASYAETETGTKRPLVLFVGRLAPEKNLDTLVAALARLFARVDGRALFCGEGPLRPYVEALVAQHGLTDRVLLAGYAPNVWASMKGAAVTVSLSLFEGCPNTVLEAMACGSPLVLSDIPAHRELLDDQSALFVAPRDADAAARALEETLCRREASARRASLAASLAERYALPRIAQQYVNVYDCVTMHRPSGSSR